MRSRFPNSSLVYELTRLRSSPSPWRTVMRRWFWIFIRRWETEICGACGRPVCPRGPGAHWSWWSAEDWLWLEVEGSTTGVRCLPCFTEDGRAAGHHVYWRPVIDAR